MLVTMRKSLNRTLYFWYLKDANEKEQHSEATRTRQYLKLSIKPVIGQNIISCTRVSTRYSGIGQADEARLMRKLAMRISKKASSEAQSCLLLVIELIHSDSHYSECVSLAVYIWYGAARRPLHKKMLKETPISCKKLKLNGLIFKATALSWLWSGESH